MIVLVDQQADCNGLWLIALVDAHGHTICPKMLPDSF